MSAMRLAVVIGHNARSRGAVRKDTGETEYEWNGRLAKIMEDLACEYHLTLKVFRRTAGAGYYKQIRQVYAATDGWGADASIELHFNSSANPKSTGVEMLSSGSTRSLALAAAVQGQMVDVLGLRDRGVKIRTAQQRGGPSLHWGRAPAILGEPFFGSNRDGLLATDEVSEMQTIARAYLRGAQIALMSWSAPLAA